MGSHVYSRAVKSSLAGTNVSKELENQIRNYVRNEMKKREKKYRADFDLVNKELFEGGVISWFNNQVRKGLSREGMNTILNSYVIESDKPVLTENKNGDIIIKLKSRFVVESSVFEQNMKSSNVAWFNKWNEKYGKGYNAGDFILGLQMNYGIYGLPKDWEHPNMRMGGITENPYYSEGVPLMQYLVGNYKNNSGSNNGAGGTSAGHYKRMFKKVVKKYFPADVINI